MAWRYYNVEYKDGQWFGVVEGKALALVIADNKEQVVMHIKKSALNRQPAIMTVYDANGAKENIIIYGYKK